MRSSSFPSSGRRQASIAILSIAWTLAAVAIALVPFTDPTWHVGQWYGLVDTTDAVVFGAVAYLLLGRGSHVVSWLVALCAVGGGLAAVAFQWTMVAMAHPGAPELRFLQPAQNWAWLPGTYAMIVLVPLLVRRTPLRRIDVGFLTLGSAAIVALTAVRLTDPYPWPNGPSASPLAIRSQWWLDAIERTVSLQFGLVCLLAAIATGDLIRRRRRQSRNDRRGLGWLAVGAALMAAAFVPLAMPVAWTSSLPSWLTPVLHLSSQMFFPAALLVAVLGQRITGLEFLIRRATLWALLSGLMLGIYVATLAIGARVLPTDESIVIAAATAVVALSFTPARRSLQGHIDALVHGDGRDASRALTRVGRQLGAASDDAELLSIIAESVRHTLRLGGLAIEVDWPGGARRVASVGELSPPSTVERELVVQRETVGRILVSGRPGELLDRSTMDSLDDLAPVVAAVVQLVARTRELIESRARIVGARDDERRALRRELHDGFGPGLAGVALGLRASHNLLGTSPDAAASLIEKMADEVDQRVEEVRTLARGLLPPVLDELGLVPAINELADRHRIVGDIDIVVRADEIAVDGTVRHGVYGIVAEAVRNVVRHAAATTCTIELTATQDHLVVTVDDDGRGLPAHPVSGVGLLSMNERAVGLGGSLEMVRLERGTRVSIRVPLVLPVPSAP